MNPDILVISAHPDDAELCCAGTITCHIAQGKTVGMIDLTRGEMGTRGTPELRLQEADRAAEILKVSFRDNMGFEDYFFKNDEEHQAALVKKIRQYRPAIILTNAVSDRHPDHGKASELVEEAVFLSGLRKFETSLEGKQQEAYRPAYVYHYIQNNYIEPDVIVDVSAFWDIKVEAIKAFSSQFYNPESKEPQSFISSREFFHFIEARGREYGHKIGVEFGEGFTINKSLGVKNLFSLV